MTDRTDALVVEDVSKHYGRVRALEQVTLRIAQGQILGLLGENGAGKTTLVSIVAGLRRPDSGSAEIRGVDVRRHPQRARRELGLVPQQLGIYPVLTVVENLRFFGRLSGVARPRLETAMRDVAEALFLTEVMDREARALSIGQQRRLHTACALLHEPALLILDEATAGVDVRTRNSIIELVRSLSARGTAVCYSTHYLAEVESLGGRVAILHRGRLLLEGPLEEVVRDHGACSLELTFEGSAPEPTTPQPLPGGVAGPSPTTVGSKLIVPTDNPTEAIAKTMRSLGRDADRVVAIEIVRPTLESVFLAVTGRRFASGEGDHTDARAT